MINNDIDCLQAWKEELRLTQNALVRAEAEAQMACATYSTIANIKAKLNIYLDNINITITIINKIQDELGILDNQVADVCEKTVCTIEAMKILHCLIKEFLMCTDTFMVSISTLINKIECLNLSGKPSIVLKCLQALSGKLDVVISGQAVLMKAIIKIVQSSIEINKLLCNTECGVTHYINVMSKRYTSLTIRKKNNDRLIDVKSEKGTKTEFMAALRDNLKQQFPLTNDPFYRELDTWVSSISTVCDEAKEECDKQRQEADLVRACKENLENAIAAATEAKACK